jgi:hypothetical protein
MGMIRAAIGSALQKGMEAKKNKVWQGRPNLAYRRLADGGLLYDQERKEVHHFNATAALVWESCQEGRTAEEMVSALRRLYEVGEERARGDVRRVLRTLVARGLLEP